MALARSVLERLKSSDGRIRVKTLSGVSALVAAIALLVGVLPAMADSHNPPTTTLEVQPEIVSYGGGSGACKAEIEGHLPSAAEFEFHIHNPKAGQIFTNADGIQVTVGPQGRMFEFEVIGATNKFVVYDAVVNGGPQNNHYDYIGHGIVDAKKDTGLHAPPKSNGDLNNLSHINICYDIQRTLFHCGIEEDAVLFGEQGEFTGATATIFTVKDSETCQKLGAFFIEGGETTLDFGTGTGEVTGRADFFKQFDGGAAITALEYNGGPAAGFEMVPWCSTAGEPHADFEEINKTPGLPTEPSGHTACKVYEEENADGFQHTVVYFEFEDPQFR